MYKELVQYLNQGVETLKTYLCDWAEILISKKRFEEAKEYLAFCLKECEESYRPYLLMFMANNAIKDVNKGYKNRDISFKDQYFLASMHMLKKEDAALYEKVLSGEADLRKSLSYPPKEHKKIDLGFSKNDKIGLVVVCIFFIFLLIGMLIEL